MEFSLVVRNAAATVGNHLRIGRLAVSPVQALYRAVRSAAIHFTFFGHIAVIEFQPGTARRRYSARWPPVALGRDVVPDVDRNLGGRTARARYRSCRPTGILPLKYPMLMTPRLFAAGAVACISATVGGASGCTMFVPETGPAPQNYTRSHDVELALSLKYWRIVGSKDPMILVGIALAATICLV